jgi:hypothetical protein
VVFHSITTAKHIAIPRLQLLSHLVILLLTFKTQDLGSRNRKSKTHQQGGRKNMSERKRKERNQQMTTSHEEKLFQQQLVMMMNDE